MTTLVTVEGRTLTEVKLTVKNQAQPFLKVNLPAGATIVSADVAGEKVKPVQGPDGNRVPLLRAGFRPTGPYEVSFVFMHSGTPFARKGGSELALPSMDLPISLLEWELFLPEQYKVKDFGGDAIAAYLLPTALAQPGDTVPSTFAGSYSGVSLHGFNSVQENQGLDRQALFVPGVKSAPLAPGQLEGYVADPQGAMIAGAEVKLVNVENGKTMKTRTDSNGHWSVFGMPPGRVRIEAVAQGFHTSIMNTRYEPGRTGRYDVRLNVGDTSSTVEITTDAPLIETTQSQVVNTFSGSVLTNSAEISEGRNGRDYSEKKIKTRRKPIPSPRTTLPPTS